MSEGDVFHPVSSGIRGSEANHMVGKHSFSASVALGGAALTAARPPRAKRNAVEYIARNRCTRLGGWEGCGPKNHGRKMFVFILYVEEVYPPTYHQFRASQVARRTNGRHTMCDSTGTQSISDPLNVSFSLLVRDNVVRFHLHLSIETVANSAESKYLERLFELPPCRVQLKGTISNLVSR